MDVGNVSVYRAYIRLYKIKLMSQFDLAHTTVMLPITCCQSIIESRKWKIICVVA